MPTMDSIIVSANSSGLLDLFLPFNNEYVTTFDTTSYQCVSYKKSIHQGSFQQKLICQWNDDNQTFEYRKLGVVSRKDLHHNIFSLLARVKTVPADSIDTKWFYTEHEGGSYRSRFLSAGSTLLNINQDSVECVHYRLDLLPYETKNIKVLDQTDYFSRNITHQNGIRQIWVDHKNDEIIQASLALSNIPIFIRKNP